jgi:hypothetical protein
MDDDERKKFYSATPDDADEGDEYELEPADPEILAGHHRRAQETLESSRLSVDFDEIYREAEHDHGSEILENWIRNFHFRFQLKHLLVATAVLAILLTLYKLGLLGVVVLVGIMLSVAGLYLYLQWQEKKQQAVADRRREAMYARRREQLRQGASAENIAHAEAEVAEPIEPPPPVASEIDEPSQKTDAPRELRFRFSMQQLMIATTAAAVVFGLTHLLGSPSSAATLLGLIALGGLVIHAIGVDPPEIVVLCWWLTLVMYILVSIAGALWSAST